MEVYEQLTAWLDWQRRMTGRSLDRKRLIAIAWQSYAERLEPPDLSLIGGPRRDILIPLLRFLSLTPESRHEAKIIDSLLAAIKLSLDMLARLKRRKK